MPKDFAVGGRINTAMMERQMYHTVVTASNPERALKNEVFRVKGELTPLELNMVLGGVYGRLGRNERTVHLASYLKDLYAVGKDRRLFVPKPLGGVRHRLGVKLQKLTAHEVKEVEMMTTTGEIVKVNVTVPKVEQGAGTKVSFKGKQPLVAASGGGSSGIALPDGNGSFNNKLNLESITQYCLKTTKYYDEVKPVYDMLMELLFLEDNPQWLRAKKKIRARLDELGTRTASVIRETPNHDGRRRATRTGKIVPAVYEYKYLNDEEDGKLRLAVLYQLLLKKEWIDGSTKPETFMGLFNGIPSDIRIKWMGSQADLYALIKNLCDKKLIVCPKGATRWVIARSHFVDSNSVPFGDFNRQKENVKSKDTVSYFVNVLNPVIPLDEKVLDLLENSIDS